MKSCSIYGQSWLLLRVIIDKLTSHCVMLCSMDMHMSIERKSGERPGFFLYIFIYSATSARTMWHTKMMKTSLYYPIMEK